MKKTCLVIIILLSACVSQPRLRQEDSGRDPAFEQEIHDRLAAIDPAAVPVFQAATAAVDAGDLEAARQGYEEVLALVPDFPDALRRLSYIEWKSGNVARSLAYANLALRIQDSPYNHIALVYPLLASGEMDNLEVALGHAQAAVAALPDDEDANVALMYAGMMIGDWPAVRRATDKLLEIGSDNAEAHYQAGLLAAEDGEWEKAERELRLARELGKPADLVQHALDTRIAGQARLSRFQRWGAWAIAVWLIGLAVLFPLGELLNRLTLRAVERADPRPWVESGIGGAVVRTLYSAVITLAALWFYVSLAALVVMAAELAVVLFQILIGFGVFFTIYVAYVLVATVRSILVWVRQERPRRSLTRYEAPKLWALVEDVARRVGARPVSAIYIRPAPSISVERGVLHLGFGVLPEMTQGQLRVILGQRCGDFAVGNGFVWCVRCLMVRVVDWLEETRWLNRYNAVWRFLDAFSRGFLRITLGASYLREIVADRRAAEAYGVPAFVNGVTHLVRQSLAFELRLSHEMKLQVDMQPHQRVKFAAGEAWRAVENFYTPSLFSELLQEQLQMRVDEAMGKPASPYDGRPAPRERIRLVERLEAQAPTAMSGEPVWDLLPNVEALQEEMTDALQAVMQRRMEASRLSARRRFRDWW